MKRNRSPLFSPTAGESGENSGKLLETGDTQRSLLGCPGESRCQRKDFASLPARVMKTLLGHTSGAGKSARKSVKKKKGKEGGKQLFLAVALDGVECSGCWT